MNLPNKLTVLRVLLVPFFVLFLLVDSIPYHNLFALLVFSVAAVTDALDGNIARKRNLVTTFGKFLDPLADKVLVLSALICFIALDYASPVVVLIVVTREFMVTSLRLVAAADGTVIAASIYGKIKTIVQMVSIVAILLMTAVNEIILHYQMSQLNLGKNEYIVTGLGIDIVFIAQVLMWVTAAATVISGIDYLLKNRSCINTIK